MKSVVFIFSAAILLASPGAAAQSDAFAEELEAGTADTSASATNDPWEGFNRKMFAVNNVLDEAIVVPAAKVYRATTHKKQRKGIRNLLANARAPFTFVNDILQGEFKRAGDTASRFVVNTTIGFGGMGDPAARMGIEPHTEDFGQTLAVWGLDSGPYLYLPFFGPSTLRDGFGMATETVADPVFWLRTDAASYTRYARTGATALSVREPLLEPLADIKENSLDYYASVRSFYLQSRRREIANGQTDFDDLPDIGGFDDFDELDELLEEDLAEDDLADVLSEDDQ
ncbi:MAG: VacJ family lipoprotein [Marinicaulis sp.]|nr:VacJ family lipoprotein [Marinicaulis sp.]